MRQLRWLLAAGLLFGAILLPFALFEDPVTATATAWLEPGAAGAAWFAFAVTVLLALDVFLPVPSSIVAVSAGYLLGPIGGTAAAFAGMTAGCALGYLTGATAARALSDSLLAEDQRARLSAGARHAGWWTLAVSRPVPVLAEASILIAGATRLDFGKTMLVSSSANLVVAAVYANAGAMGATAGSVFVPLFAVLVIPASAIGAHAAWSRRRLLPGDHSPDESAPVTPSQQ